MPPKFDFAHTTQLDTVELLTSRPSRIDFDAGDGLHLVVEAHAPGVYRLRCGEASLLTDEKSSARARAVAEMLLARQEAVGEATLTPRDDGGGWRIAQGDTTLEVLSDPVRVKLYRGDQEVFASEVSAHTPAFGHNALDETDEAVWTVGLGLEGAEPVYGLGETPGDLNRRGEAVVSDDPEHRALPLAWSPRGWGVYANTMRRVEHAVGLEPAEGAYVLTIDDPVLDLFLFVGEPAEILNQYTALTGRAGQPVLWAMGAWLQQADGQMPTETAALVARLRDQQIALDAVTLALPAAWSFQADKPVLEWDAQRFPDARQMLALFHKHHVHVAASGFPGVLKSSLLFEELEDRGWLLTRDDGSAQVFDGNAATGGQPYGLLDLSYRDAYAMWVERHRQLIEDGLDAPACDAQIAIPDGVSARNGETGPALRTMYPLLARRALFDAVAGLKVPPEGVVPSTDLFPAAQRLPWQVGPRVTNDWAGLEHSLRTALSIGASGVPVQVHALGSAQAPLEGMTAELYLRWLGACVLSANFSFQGVPGLLPDAFGEEALAHARTWMQWRYRLIPYVLGAIEDSARTGLPVQRSMAMSFPHDPHAHAWDLQYLLGPALLVAPVTQPGKQVRVYLPKGDAWWDLNTGHRYEGGTTWTVECELDRYPVFGREGHMLCLGPAAQHTGEFNSARILDEVWMFGMPVHNPVVMRNKIRVMQMQGSSYIKGLEGLRILPSEGLEVKRRGAEVRISRAR
ncbi:glycosyl hydrolase [Bordetella pertussis]|uniref:Glycosyl hydrolase n=11 Tax=Bordetella TaxID=517 RepID=Q7VV73_BORPE|nr:MULTISPECIES: glycoside hydrolase family 31 protein [Bordetella]ETH42195.1 glycoside hydrolase, family 31 [Bordetella pertussis H939]ETH46645.1 glycoside hydrolase, family 31 [Bordetella pertussis H921]ETH71497.1 glycoside hydrolase, family 31 [Bordetella pertussis STO1-CHLA-0011]ETH83159.1 glycoside hydrolase, family 31 [Bordetella pertussis STO1-CHOC-0017]ETI00215.1 glycoside hydrolase, family 31 [Bordetella pertussis STO1-CHOM-0012]SHQ87978.1 Alpha-xylosidase [Mycobacteroides abscessus 